MNQLNYYPWLTDEEYGNECKRKAAELYEAYYAEQDKKEKEELFKSLSVYITLACDVIAYRYLVKNYSYIFRKLNSTVEEYMDYKSKRMLATIKNKKEHIDDILAYIYMSFMLSSPSLIYAYGEQTGRCKIVRETLPYFITARNGFFLIERKQTLEHVIYAVDTLELNAKVDSNTNQSIRSTVDRYSFDNWKNKRQEDDENEEFENVITYIKRASMFSKESRKYLLHLIRHWQDDYQSQYLDAKEDSGSQNFSMVDYVQYEYRNGNTNLNNEDYLDVLKLLNTLLKLKEKNGHV